MLIPIYYEIERKYINSDEGRSISLFLYSFTQKDLSITQKYSKLDLKYNEIEISPNTKHILLLNKIPDCRNIFGEAVLLVCDKESIFEVTKLSLSEKFKNVSFDDSGRYFCLELNRVNSSVTEGFKIFFISGELLVDIKSKNLVDFLWRPRHKKLISYEESLKCLNVEETFIQLENEDNEFLSEHDKEKRKNYNEKMNKIYDVVKRRQNQWKEFESKRKEIYNPLEEEITEYYIYQEEIIKSEEKVEIKL